MQLFIISPLFLYPILKNVNLGLSILLACALISLGYQTHLFQTKHYSAAAMAQPGPLTSDYYVSTICRCNTYFVGVLFCYLYLESKNKAYLKSSFLHFSNRIFSNIIVRYCIVLFGLFLMIFVIFSQNYFDHSLDVIPQYVTTLYLLFDRILFVLGMMLFVYPSLLGYGRIQNSFFGHPFFNIFARITYGTYMIHLIYIQLLESIVKNGSIYEYYQMLIISTQIFFLVYFVSFICTLIFESPAVQLLKLLTQYLNSNNRSNSKESTPILMPNESSKV